jgi:hypothetical protein
MTDNIRDRTDESGGREDMLGDESIRGAADEGGDEFEDLDEEMDDEEEVEAE